MELTDVRQNLLTVSDPETAAVSGIGGNVFGGVIILCLVALVFVVILILIVRSYKSKTNSPMFNLVYPENDESLTAIMLAVESKQKALADRTSELAVANKAVTDAQSAATEAERAAIADPTNIDKQTASKNAAATVIDKQNMATAAKHAADNAELEYSEAKQRADDVKKQQKATIAATTAATTTTTAATTTTTAATTTTTAATTTTTAATTTTTAATTTTTAATTTTTAATTTTTAAKTATTAATTTTTAATTTTTAATTTTTAATTTTTAAKTATTAATTTTTAATTTTTAATTTTTAATTTTTTARSTSTAGTTGVNNFATTVNSDPFKVPIQKFKDTMTSSLYSVIGGIKRDSSTSVTPTDFEVVNLENVAVGNPTTEYNTDANPINTQRARRYIAKKDTLNPNLKNFTIDRTSKRSVMYTTDADPETDDDVNIAGVWESVAKNSTEKPDSKFDDWQSSSENFRTLCSIMLDSIRFIHTKDSQVPEFGKASADAQRVMAKIYADRFMQDIVGKRSVIAKNPNLPWGTEWYDFGVNLTAVIAQYLLLPDCKFQKDLSEIILLLIPNPQFVCGKQRKNYAALLLGPWFMANHHLDRLKDAVKSADYRKARQSVIAKIQRKPFARGLHLDGSYFAHDPPVPAYTVLKETFNEKSMYYYYLDTSLVGVLTYNNIWHIPMRIICHPTIALGNTGMFGRPTTNLGYVAGGELNPKYRAPLGLAVMPFSRFLRYYTVDRMFSVRGQDTRMGFIHADPQTVYNSRFWVQSRVVYTDKDVEKPLALPWPGLTKRTDLKQLPNEDLTFPELESVGPIAPPPSFVVGPKDATSFVLRYNEFGVFYNNYDITTYENSINRELIVVNATKQTIDMQLDVINKEYEADIEYFLQDNTKVVIPRMVPPRDLEVTSIHQTINLYGSTVRNPNPKAIVFPIKITDTVEVRDLSATPLGAYVLFDSGKPKVIAFNSLESELNEMTLKIDNVPTKIKFDFDTNQYLVVVS